MNPTVSVIIATRNRTASLVRLLRQLGEQSIAADRVEIVVVDDGSSEAVAPALDGLHLGVRLQALRAEGVGPGAARHHGVLQSGGAILVFLDDDMQVGPEFLAAHVNVHERVPGAVVLGRIDPDPALAGMPLFERFHARQMDRWRLAVSENRSPVQGMHLCAGNFSVTRRDYDAVGGFDTSLRYAEDRELGIRLELHGCTLCYADAAATIHSSDHASVAVWLRRPHTYGRLDHQIAKMHPRADAHPWRFWALIHPLSQPVVAVSLVWPAAGHLVAWLVYATAVMADRVGLARLALTLTACSFGLEYFRGLREQFPSFSAFRREVRAVEGRRSVLDEWRDFRAAVRADHDSVREHRKKYHGEDIAPGRIWLDLVRKVGFQMLAWYRLMRLADACRVPLAPMVISRVIRHLYGAEIHWKARLAPGVSVIHGTGLVISHAAEVGTGCILFQGVTLGESISPLSGEVGAPRLGPRVHVGPGSQVIGPIVVGDGTKIAAGSVLTRSVPANSLVAPPEAVVTARQRGSRQGRAAQPAERSPRVRTAPAASGRLAVPAIDVAAPALAP